MNKSLINTLLESLDVFDLADTLRNNIKEEDVLISLWNKYKDDDDYTIYTIDILNVALANKPFTKALKELHPTFSVRDKYCYYNGEVWVTFYDLFNTLYSPFGFHSLACYLKPALRKFIEEEVI